MDAGDLDCVFAIYRSMFWPRSAIDNFSRATISGDMIDTDPKILGLGYFLFL